MTDETLPTVTAEDMRASGLDVMKMSPGLALYFNDAIYNRCKQIAGAMSRADGMMPKHLLGKPEACFMIVTRAIVWKLDPGSVAMATYQTPSGSIGFTGTLVQAILENSGALEGGVSFKHEGDWSKVQGKFRIQESPKGGKYPVPTWGPDDAAGLYVTVSAKMRGELEPRTLRFDLNEAFPLNSPLWATAPNRQICYTACRAFANIAVPSLLMGVPFDVDPTGFYSGTPMEDITPRPKVGSPFERSQEEPKTATGEPQGQQAVDAPQTDEAAEDGAPAGSAEAEGTTEKTAEPKGTEEAVMDRGKRLLKSLGATNDVADLRLSIQDELEAGELDGPGLLAVLREWNGACDARSKEIATPDKKAPTTKKPAAK